MKISQTMLENLRDSFNAAKSNLIKDASGKVVWIMTIADSMTPDERVTAREISARAEVHYE